jgi:hypothetical protein
VQEAVTKSYIGTHIPHPETFILELHLPNLNLQNFGTEKQTAEEEVPPVAPH